VRLPARLRNEAGRHALVDGIPFELPIDSERARALMAAFPIDAERAAEALPGDELHPLRISPNRGLLLITVIDYQATDIGLYVEFSIGIACTHGLRPAPPLLPALLARFYGTGQYVYDLPVSTEISVKGGKGIWGMPKHQAYLEFEVEPRRAASRYWLDEQVEVEVEVRRPRFGGLPFASTGVNYSAFRGMLFRSWIHFRARAAPTCPSLARRGLRSEIILASPRSRSSGSVTGRCLPLSCPRSEAPSTTTSRVGSFPTISDPLASRGSRVGGRPRPLAGVASAARPKPSPGPAQWWGRGAPPLAGCYPLSPAAFSASCGER
jgi:hypothetical protein